MSRNQKRSVGWTAVLITLGMIAFFGGVKWLAVLIPAAVLVWYGALPTLGGGRN